MIINPIPVSCRVLPGPGRLIVPLLAGGGAGSAAQLLAGRHPGDVVHVREQDHGRLLRRRGGRVPALPRVRSGLRV